MLPTKFTHVTCLVVIRKLALLFLSFRPAFLLAGMTEPCQPARFAELFNQHNILLPTFAHSSSLYLPNLTG